MGTLRHLFICNVLSGSNNSQSLQDPGSQMTLGERKRNGPRVLVNKLTVNHNVIERLRRITKLCGKHSANGKVENQSAEVGEVVGSNPTENGKDITNGSHIEKDEEKRPPQENGSKESSAEESKQSKSKTRLKFRWLLEHPWIPMTSPP